MILAAAVLLGACVAAELAALGLAVVVVARTRLPFRRPVTFSALGLLLRRIAPSPLVRLLAFAVLADVLGAVCSHVADMGPRPRAGWHRVAYHLADGLVMAWPVAVCWTARGVFRDGAGAGAERSKRPVNLGVDLQNRRGFRWSTSGLPAVVPASFSLGTLALVLAHPVPRVWTQRTLHAHELLCVAVTWWTIWQSRPRAGAPLRPWRVEHRALVVLASFEAVVATVGPFAGDVFARWPVVGAVLYLAAFSTVAGLLGWNLRASSSRALDR